jgi:hypothetical protein
MTGLGSVLGKWWIRSKSDPRWDREGRGEGGGLYKRPPAVDRTIKNLSKTLGEPPNDLEWGFSPD